MKTLRFLSALLLGGALFAGCQKENTTEDEPQGTNYNLLLKTVTTSNYSNQRITTVYTYNSSGKVINITTTGVDAPAGNFTNTEIFTRNTAGLPENIEFTSVSTGPDTRISTQNFFDATGKTIRTIQVINSPVQQTRDSALYTYAGNTLQQRTEYRSLYGAPYSLLVTANYQFSGAGNLDRAIFAWATHPGIDTLNFSYDDKVNSLPLGRADNFYWTELFYDDLKSPNNVRQFNCPSLSNYSNEYRYSANNKPVYRKTIYTGTSNYDETYYYYD